MAKALSGEPGSGASAYLIKLSADTNIFAFDKDGVIKGDGVARFTASRQNIDELTTWSFYDENLTPVNALYTSSNGDYGELLVGAFGTDSSSIQVKVEANGYIDAAKVTRVFDGETFDVFTG